MADTSKTIRCDLNNGFRDGSSTVAIYLTETRPSTINGNWAGSREHELGRCKLEDYGFIEQALKNYLAAHPEEMADDNLAALRDIVWTVKSRLFDLEIEADQKPARSKTLAALENLTLPFPGPLPEPGSIKRGNETREQLMFILWSRPIAEVRAAAVGESTRNSYQRSVAVTVYVQQRAAGRCEACGQAAAFETPEGRPFLIPYHTIKLTDGGPDHPRWVIALCPTCHSRAQHGADAKEFGEVLVRVVNGLERE